MRYLPLTDEERVTALARTQLDVFAQLAYSWLHKPKKLEDMEYISAYCRLLQDVLEMHRAQPDAES